MNENKTKYLLGVLVTLVWGLVGYRIYMKYFGKEQNVPINRPLVFEEKQKIKKDTFELIKGYNDPFQYAEIQHDERSVPPSLSPSFAYNRYPSVSIEQSKQEIKPIPVIFPEINYKGNIKSKTGRVVALLSVEGTVANLAVNESLKDIRVSDIYNDSVRVNYKNVFKTILKVQQ